MSCTLCGSILILGIGTSELLLIGQGLQASQISWKGIHKFVFLLQEKEEGQDNQKPCARVRCAILLLSGHEPQNRDSSVPVGRSGFIQIGPSKDGPWTTVRLNYAAPAACWRFGNNIVASEVSVKNGDRYVDIRSLVTVKNSTDLTLDMRLKLMSLDEGMTGLSDPYSSEGGKIKGRRPECDEYFETEIYDKNNGWVGYSFQPKQNNPGTGPRNVSSA